MLGGIWKTKVREVPTARMVVTTKPDSPTAGFFNLFSVTDSSLLLCADRELGHHSIIHW